MLVSAPPAYCGGRRVTPKLLTPFLDQIACGKRKGLPGS